MSEQSFLSLRTALAFFDPESWSWRTSQGSLLSEAPPLLDRLPPWGITQGGVLFELPMPSRLIDVRDGSALLGLPTPVVNDMGAGNGLQSIRPEHRLGETSRAPGEPASDPDEHGQPECLRLLPTPTGRDHKGRNQRNDDSCLPGAIVRHVEP